MNAFFPGRVGNYSKLSFIYEFSLFLMKKPPSFVNIFSWVLEHPLHLLLGKLDNAP